MKRWNLCSLRSSGSGGFTLIELLVIVVIIGILGAIAAPGWLGYLNRQRISSVKSDLFSTIRQTQSDAKQRSTRRRVVLRNSAEGPVVDVEEVVNFETGEGRVVKVQKMGTDVQGVEISSFVGDTTDADNAQDSITFDHRGSVVATSGQTVPFTVKVESVNTSVTQCVIVSTLLGSLSEAVGDECNNPDPAI